MQRRFTFSSLTATISRAWAWLVTLDGGTVTFGKAVVRIGHTIHSANRSEQVITDAIIARALSVAFYWDFSASGRALIGICSAIRSAHRGIDLRANAARWTRALAKALNRCLVAFGPTVVAVGLAVNATDWLVLFRTNTTTFSQADVSSNQSDQKAKNLCKTHSFYLD